ncbi:TPA: hypothetical protein DEP90_01645 [Patescibacteria group bacterium]|nr:hypothetical protein [Patescibacteria group bacterium]
MKVNLNKEISNYQKGVVKDEKGKPVIMRDLIVMAINSVGPKEEWGKDNKIMAYNLSLRLMSKDEVELSIDEMKYILDCVGQVTSPLIIGTLNKWFENK